MAVKRSDSLSRYGGSSEDVNQTVLKKPKKPLETEFKRLFQLLIVEFQFFTGNLIPRVLVPFKKKDSQWSKNGIVAV